MRPIARYGFLGSVRKLLSQAAFFIDAKESGMGQTATNLGTAGSVLDAQYGSTTGSDTNDPLLLEHDGTNYLYTPDSANNFASTPDAAALDITGAVDLRGRFRRTTGSSDGYLLIKGSSYATLSYAVVVTSAGNLGIYTKDSAGNARDYTSTATVPYGATDAFWWRVACDPVAATVTFYTAADQATLPTSWTQLGAVVSGTWTGSALQANNEALHVNFSVDGEVYRAQVLNGIGGTVVFDANFTTGITSGGQTTFTESSSNAATVTINRSTSGRKSVAVVRDVWLFGTDDYMEVADNDLLDFGASDSFTVVVAMRSWNAPAVAGRLLDKFQGATGYLLSHTTSNTNQLYLSATGIAQSDSGTFTNGALTLASAVRNVATDNVTAYLGTTPGTAGTDNTTTTLANGNPLAVGRQNGGGNYEDMELLGVAIFRRALSDDEIASIANYYGAS